MELLELMLPGLPAEHLDALRGQGFVAGEIRRGRPIYKLRYRFGGRQVVRSLGAEPRRAEAVRGELERLQRNRRTERDLNRLVRRARERLRTAKRESAPLLAELGLAFRGMEIRRPRSAAAVAGGGTPPAEAGFV